MPDLVDFSRSPHILLPLKGERQLRRCGESLKFRLVTCFHSSSDYSFCFSQYLLLGTTIRGITEYRTKIIFDSLRSTSETFSAYAQEVSDNSFPFITLPDFEVVAKHARKRSGVETLNYLPIVTKANRVKWERYATENFDGWMQESRVSAIR